ncbi:MAG: hypothetical protein JXR60_08410 [Bacteroidales bacterium]|nr:hypothetical protein [Bacteroidales bacterium]
MDAKISKIVQYIMYALLGISVVMILIFFFGGTDVATFANEKDYTYPSFTDNIIYWTYALFLVATVSAVLFSVYLVVSDFKKAKNALIGVGALLVVVGIAYAMASDVIPTFYNADKFNITESVSKWVGTGLFTTYLLGGIAVVGIIITEFSKSFK